MPIWTFTTLPYGAKQLAAYMFPAGPTVGHDALGRRQNVYPHSVQHSRDLVMADVNPASGPADSFHARYDIVSTYTVLKMNPNNALLIVLDQFEILDVALFLKNARQAALHL